MDIDQQEKEIREGLKKLTRTDVVYFAWICGVLSLPFLTVAGNLNYWASKGNRQHHLISVFNALDNTIGTMLCSPSTDVYTVLAAARAAARVSKDVFSFADDNSYNIARAAAYVARAVSYAAYAAYAAYAVTFTDVIEALDVVGAATATATATATAAADKIDYIYSSSEFYSFLLTILGIIETKSNLKKVILPVWYQTLFGRFLETLEREGCPYWGNLYKHIIESGFQIDEEELKFRMQVPAVIRAQGAEAVSKYMLDLLDQGVETLDEARIVILGEKGAGKTCLARKLVDSGAEPTTDADSTPGVDIAHWKPAGRHTDIRIWDFAGHTITHAVHRFFLSEQCLYIIVYDGRTEDRNRLTYWLDFMKSYGGDSQAIIVVNKRDAHPVEIPINTLKEKYNIFGLYTFSVVEEGQELEGFKNIVLRYLEENLSWNSKVIPVRDYKVKTELERLFDSCRKNGKYNFISQTEFDSISRKYEIPTENIKQLMLRLHTLGVALWYEGLQKYNTLILNPEWISYGIYKIMNWTFQQGKYAVVYSDFAEIFRDVVVDYPEDKFLFLFDLMKEYELAYEDEGSTERSLIIPSLLKEDRPERIPDFPVMESLALRYKTDTLLPPDLLSRFIVKYNKNIVIDEKKQCVCAWRDGVILEDKTGTVALVRKEDAILCISVKGKNKTQFISHLRETCEIILEGYRNRDIQIEYKIQGYGEMPTADDVWMTDKAIESYSAAKKEIFHYPSGQMINPLEVSKKYGMPLLVQIINNPEKVIQPVSIGNQGVTTFNTDEFTDCTISFQGDLKTTARLLKNTGCSDESETLEEIAQTLDQVENPSDKEALKKTGALDKLKAFAEQLGDGDSKLSKCIKGVRNGAEFLQRIGRGYNEVAGWVGLPSIPKIFIGSDKSAT